MRRLGLWLGHGITGLCSVLISASRVLSEARYEEVACEVGCDIWSKYSAANSWPSGIASGGPNPSLMLGVAGVGYFFLRAGCSEVPDILALEFGSVGECS